MMSDEAIAWSNAIEDYTDEHGVISGVPTSRVGERGDECPLCHRRVPSQGLDDDYQHDPLCNWRKMIRAQQNFASYGVRDPFAIENGKGKVRVTVTYELDVDFVSDMAFESQVERDFTDPHRAVGLSMSGSTVYWKRRAGTIDNIEWLERTEPQERERNTA